MKRVPLFPILLGLLCLACFSCEKKVPTPLPEEEGINEYPTIFVIFPPNGPGDNGYLDKVMSAVSRFSIAHPGTLRILQTYEENVNDFGAEYLLSLVDFCNRLAQEFIPYTVRNITTCIHALMKAL